jgi:hypothetical protein
LPTETGYFANFCRPINSGSASNLLQRQVLSVANGTLSDSDGIAPGGPVWVFLNGQRYYDGALTGPARENN